MSQVLKKQYPLVYMQAMAARIKKHLEPHTERIDIAGSVRRQAAFCSDIEIVCIAKLKKELVPGSLFPIEQDVNQLEKLFKEGKFKQILKNGERYKQVILTDSTPVDFFITNANDYGRQLAIRTGCANYSKRLAGTWVRKGWVGTEDGLRRKDECREISNKWVCMRKDPTLPPKFKTELDFFNFLEMAMIDPRVRNK